MRKFQYLVLFGLFTLPTVFTAAVRAEGSGSGVSGGSYYQIDFSKILPDELVTERMIHYSALVNNALEFCDYRISFKDRYGNLLSNIPWEYFVRTTIKIKNDRDEFRSNVPQIVHKIYGRMGSGKSWLDVMVKTKDANERGYKKTIQQCYEDVVTGAGELHSIVWIKKRGQVAIYLTQEDLKKQIDLAQGVLYSQLEMGNPETYGNYASFLRIADQAIDLRWRVKMGFSEYPQSLAAFQNEILKLTNALISETENLQDGDTIDQQLKFLDAYDVWATKVDAWKIGTPQWVTEFELKSQTKLDSRMVASLEAAKNSIDRRLSQLAIQAERVRRSLAAKAKGKTDQPSDKKPKNQLKVEN